MMHGCVSRKVAPVVDQGLISQTILSLWRARILRSSSMHLLYASEQPEKYPSSVS